MRVPIFVVAKRKVVGWKVRGGGVGVGVGAGVRKLTLIERIASSKAT